MNLYEWMPCFSPADSDIPAARPFGDLVTEHMFAENTLKAKKQLVETGTEARSYRVSGRLHDHDYDTYYSAYLPTTAGIFTSYVVMHGGTEQVDVIGYTQRHIDLIRPYFRASHPCTF